MKAKPILAALCVCAAAGVVTWDVKYFSPRVAPTHAPTNAAPSARPNTPVSAFGATAPGAHPATDDATDPPVAADLPTPRTGANDDSGPATPPKSGEPDFDKLFEQLVQQNALRSQVDGARDGAGLPPTPDVSGATVTADGWDRLELRGVLCGSERALALVNGRLLQVGDELPIVRWRITKILADRVIAAAPIGGLERALTLHVFESPSRKVAPAVNAGNSAQNPPSNAPASNGSNIPNTAAPASPASPAGSGGANPGTTSSGSQPASGGTNGANR
jgi:hypothetical protein